MKVKNIKQLSKFELAVNQCEGQVWLESKDGDRFNLKSEISKMIGYSRLLSEYGDYLELFCSDKNDLEYFSGLLEED